MCKIIYYISIWYLLQIQKFIVELTKYLLIKILHVAHDRTHEVLMTNLHIL